MPFCPRCKIEHVEGVLECPDCHVALVEQLPPEPEPTDVIWRALPSLPSESHGLMLVEELNAQNIRNMIKVDVFHASFGSQGTTVSVAAEQFDEALRIYKTLIENQSG